MKKYFLAASLLISLLATAPRAAAVPAKPGLMTVTASDGSELKVRLVGDEYFHYFTTEDGYLLTERDGRFFYADIDAAGEVASSGIAATAPSARSAEASAYLSKVDMTRAGKSLDRRAEMAPRRARQVTVNPFRAPSRAVSDPDAGYPAGPGLFPGTSFPSKGDQKALVVLVEYKDVKFTISNPADYFGRMLNQYGFNDYGGTGSAKEYFETCSNGLFRPEFDVFGPITLDNNMSYYGGNDWYGNDQRPEEMAIEACQKLDATIDFSEYDRDGDGYIDNVFIFYAGRGEATGGGANTVWPHSWEVSSATYTPYVFDGVRLDRYGCTNEWEGSRPDGVGTFIHEFSHVMGLPDLYATSYTSAFTPGAWSALDYGPYNNDGMTPPLYGAFERYALGWMAPAEINTALNATLPPISENVAGIIKTSKSDEFFLLENRQFTGWDYHIPGHGMLIWHIDYNSSVWSSNTVNNSSYHQYVDIEEADGSQSDYSRAGDAFPGTSNVTSFTDTTSPSMKTWSGTSLNLPITQIAETADGYITFKVKGGAEPISPAVALEPENIDDVSFTARWIAEPGLTYMITVSEFDPETGTATPVPDYTRRNVGSVAEITVTGLTPEHEYIYMVYAAKGLEVAEPSNQISVLTGIPGINRLKVEAAEPVDILSSGFTAVWCPLEGATDYLLTVFSREFGASIPETCGFDDGVASIPAGWSSSSTSSYANASYSGEAVPALRLGKSGDSLTAQYADGIRGLKFWHRGNSTDPADVINVYATTPEGRRQVASIPVVTEKGGTVTELTDFPDDTHTVRLEYVRASTKGAVAIDDVTFYHGITYSDVPVEGFDGVATGPTTSWPVTGLIPEKDYYYTVTATDGTLYSRPSDEVHVRTLAATVAIESVGADAQPLITLSGLHLAVTADSPVTVTDIAGRTVASANSHIDLTLPAPGVYIVRAGSLIRKISAR